MVDPEALSALVTQQHWLKWSNNSWFASTDLCGLFRISFYRV